MTNVENTFFSKIKYLSYFVTKAFLLAIFSLLLLIFILACIYYGDMYFNVKKGNYQSPIFDGYVIVSRSMTPTINKNDAIVIKREDNNKYNVGDIISFFSTEYDSNGMIVTHRVVDKITKGGVSSYITKGDNNPVADGDSVIMTNVYGKVMFVIPKLGYVHDFLVQPKNLAICLLIPVVLVVICDLLRIRMAIMRKKVLD